MIALVNGSPKTVDSTSSRLIERVQQKLGAEDTMIFSANQWGDDVFEKLTQCEKIVFVFPLYVDSLPSHFLRFLIDLEEYRKKNATPQNMIYSVCHCGFYEGKQCRNALDIIGHFCHRAGMLWQGGIGLGGGLLVGQNPDDIVKDLLSVLHTLTEHISKGEKLSQYIFATPTIPRFFYILGGNLGFKQTAKKNGVSAKEITK